MKLAQNVIEELWFAEGENDSSSDEAAQSLAAKIATISGMKTFPIVAQKVLSILGNPNYKVVTVTNALNEDPSMASSVMRMANSAFFGGLKTVSSIEQAFVRLGARTVREVVSAVATMSLFPDVSGVGKQIRDHCAATAALALVLTRDFAPRYTDGIFLAGLLHDIGKLFLIESKEYDYSLVITADHMEADITHLDERVKLGYDHAVLAGHVVSMWNIPEPIPKIIAWHHQPNRAYQDLDTGIMVSILRLADRIEWLFNSNLENYDTHLEQIAQSDEANYIQMSEIDLKRCLSTLYNVRADALAMFGG